MRALLLLILVGVLPATAEVTIGTSVTIAPSAPTAADVLVATIEVPSGCTLTSTTAVAGTIVRTDVAIAGCIVGPPPFAVEHLAEFGPLVAGTYIYEVYFSVEGGTPVLEAELPLIIAPAVAPAAVPTMSDAGLLLLAAAIVGAALARQ